MLQQEHHCNNLCRATKNFRLFTQGTFFIDSIFTLLIETDNSAAEALLPFSSRKAFPF